MEAFLAISVIGEGGIPVQGVLMRQEGGVRRTDGVCLRSNSGIGEVKFCLSVFEGGLMSTRYPRGR